MTLKLTGLELSQEIVNYAPVWIDGDRVVVVEFYQGDSWTPEEEFGRLQRKRGSIIALARETKKVTGFWTARIIGSNDTEEVPNFSHAEYEILRQWRWTGADWKEIQDVLHG